LVVVVGAAVVVVDVDLIEEDVDAAPVIDVVEVEDASVVEPEEPGDAPESEVDVPEEPPVVEDDVPVPEEPSVAVVVELSGTGVVMGSRVAVMALAMQYHSLALRLAQLMPVFQAERLAAGTPTMEFSSSQVPFYVVLCLAGYIITRVLRGLLEERETEWHTALPHPRRWSSAPRATSGSMSASGRAPACRRTALWPRGGPCMRSGRRRSSSS
jgi:hypothetical protein